KLEEQERARRAVERKSAEVKRQKEALLKNQEMETAKAGAEAERNKKKAEQKRQARIKATTDTKQAKRAETLDSSAAAAAELTPTTLGQWSA
ncbi:unnamed protein product, partial [Pylaiella littoralis]